MAPSPLPRHLVHFPCPVIGRPLADLAAAVEGAGAEFGAVAAIPEAVRLAVEHRALGPQAAVLVVVGGGDWGFGHDRAFGAGWRGEV